jgi:hypothetical protein
MFVCYVLQRVMLHLAFWHLPFEISPWLHQPFERLHLVLRVERGEDGRGVTNMMRDVWHGLSFLLSFMFYHGHHFLPFYLFSLGLDFFPFLTSLSRSFPFSSIPCFGGQYPAILVACTYALILHI